MFQRIGDEGLWREPPLMEDQLNADDLVSSITSITSITKRIVRGDYGG